MKKQISLLFLGLCFTVSSFAGYRGGYKCPLKNDRSYVVEISMYGATAAFFDNNQWSVLPLSKMEHADPRDPYNDNAIFTFSGFDYRHQALRLSFNNASYAGNVAYMTANGIEVVDFKCQYEADLFHVE